MYGNRVERTQLELKLIVLFAIDYSAKLHPTTLITRAGMKISTTAVFAVAAAVYAVLPASADEGGLKNAAPKENANADAMPKEKAGDQEWFGYYGGGPYYGYGFGYPGYGFGGYGPYGYPGW